MHSGLLQRPGATYALLTLVCMLLFLPGQTLLPPFDRDDARFAQASKQMLETGGYLDIRFQDQSRYKKPAGIYWLQALSAALVPLGSAAAFYYLQWQEAAVSALPALATGAVLFGLGAAWWLRRERRGIVALVLTTLFFYWSAFQYGLPAADRFWLSRGVARALEAHQDAGCPRHRLLAVDYHEPSLVFLAGTDTALAPADKDTALELSEAFLRREACGMVLVPETLA